MNIAHEEAVRLLQDIVDGLDHIVYPEHDGTREWNCELNCYLRGNAAMRILVPEATARRLEELGSTT